LQRYLDRINGPSFDDTITYGDEEELEEVEGRDNW
jgi:hypothetical protein